MRHAEPAQLMLIRLWQPSNAAQFALQLLCGEFAGCCTAAPSLSPSVSLPLCPSLSQSLLVLARVVFSFVCFQCSAGNVAGNVSLSLSLCSTRSSFFSNGRAVCYGFIFFATRTRNYNFSFNLSCVFWGNIMTTLGDRARGQPRGRQPRRVVCPLSLTLSTYTLGRRLCVVYQPGYWLLLQLLLLLLCLLTACYFYGFVAKANFAHKLQQKDKQQ